MAKPAPKSKSREPECKPAPPAPQKSKSTALARSGGGGSAPSQAAIAAAKKSGGGGGLSQKMEDNLVPLLVVLTTTSPQVVKKDPKYVEDAEAGDIWLRNDPNPIVKGSEGVPVQFCGQYSEWVEWIPRESGGGIAGRYPIDKKPKEAVQDDENPNKWYLGENDLIDTRNVILNVYHNGLDAPPDGYVMPLKSTGHGVAKGWMTNMNKKKFPGTNLTPDGWHCIYLMKSQTKTNKKGTWCLPEIHDLREDGEFVGWATDEQVAYGQAMHDAFAKGEKRAMAEDDDTRGDSGGDPEDAGGEI
jgi:hypothetical protein